MSHEMGRMVTVHHGTMGAGGWFWYLGGILVLSGFVNLFRIAGLLLGTGSRASGENLADLGLMSAGSFALSAACLAMPLSRWRQTIEVYELGFVWKRLFGSTTVRRDEIVSTEVLTVRSRMATVTNVILGLRDGRELTLAGFDGALQLGSRLHSAALANAAARSSMRSLS